MTTSPAAELEAGLAALNAADPNYAVVVVDRILAAARAARASDVHLQPTPAGLDVRWRLDGVLQPLVLLPASTAPNVVARLKVLAGLLTYRNDHPQEGRLRSVEGSSDAEIRLSTFPTLFGEKGVLRLFVADTCLLRLDDLGFPVQTAADIRRLLAETSGALLVTGPAGSGKTTTLYACLRELVASSAGGRSLASIEDPVEVPVPGVSQSQVNEVAEFTLARGLRFLLRQDPEVIFVGEIRDTETAEAALQAALTGHLLLSSFHAGSAAEAISRLSEMGIAPYALRSGVLGVLNQRLVRRLCTCARTSNDDADKLGLDVRSSRVAVGCPECRGTGYRGRTLIAELLAVAGASLDRAVLAGADSRTLEAEARRTGMVTRWDRARQAVEQGITSAAEVRRVFGFSEAGFLEASAERVE